MFTGIIEEIGNVKDFIRLSSGAKLCIKCKIILEDINIGDSICVNGVCQTVIDYDNNSFSVMLSNETLNVTNFSDINAGETVNLERALAINSRLGGHIVSGHIDCIGKLIKAEKQSEFYELTFEIPYEKTKYIVHKGSVTINGISLTIASVKDNTFVAAIIPHTYQNTNLKDLKSGDKVNIETDILAKYIEKIVKFNDNKNDISMEFLKENGFV